MFLRDVHIKETLRYTDGLLVPLDPQKELTVLENQFYRDDKIYTRIVTVMAAVQEEHNMRAVQGVIIFRHRGDDPN